MGLFKTNKQNWRAFQFWLGAGLIVKHPPAWMFETTAMGVWTFIVRTFAPEDISWYVNEWGSVDQPRSYSKRWTNCATSKICPERNHRREVDVEIGRICGFKKASYRKHAKIWDCGSRTFRPRHPKTPETGQAGPHWKHRPGDSGKESICARVQKGTTSLGTEFWDVFQLKQMPSRRPLQHLSSQRHTGRNPLGSKSLGGKKVPWSADWTLIRVPQDLKKHLWWGPMHHRSPKRRSEGTWKGPTNWSLRHIGSFWSTQIEKALLDKRLVVSAKNSACQVNYSLFLWMFLGDGAAKIFKTIICQSSISPSVS